MAEHGGKSTRFDAVLSHFFGELQIQKKIREEGKSTAPKPILTDGSANPGAHPWLSLWIRDMATFQQLSGADEFNAF